MSYRITVGWKDSEWRKVWDLFCHHWQDRPEAATSPPWALVSSQAKSELGWVSSKVILILGFCDDLLRLHIGLLEAPTGVHYQGACHR